MEMNIQNRMHDVVQLRCKACQDFFSMIAKDNWQQLLYDKGKEADDTNSKYKTTYDQAFQLMRSKGIDNYQVEDMDVTLISALIIYKFEGISSVTKETRQALSVLRSDRNVTNHSGENEAPDELYLRGLLSLCNLKNFVIAVDKYEKTIDDGIRLSYRQKYIKLTEELKTILDEERIELVYRKKEINTDINKILESKEPQKMFARVLEIYYKRFVNAKNYENNRFQKYYDFVISASDAGIAYAHSIAADYYIDKHNYHEAERRLCMLYNSNLNNDTFHIISIIQSINRIIKNGEQPTPGMIEIISELRNNGCDIIKTEKGTYMIAKK